MAQVRNQVFCVLCIATLVLLFLKYVNDKTRWKEEAEERFKAGKEEADALADDIVRIFDEKIAERTEERIEQLKPKPETAKREVQAVE